MGGLDLSNHRQRFLEEGFVHVDRLGPTDADFDAVRARLDNLFDRFAEIPNGWAKDLGTTPSSDGKPVLPEVNEVSRLDPALRRTPVYRAAGRLARALLGPAASLVYDHAIYKPPGATGVTSWHQDSGYDQTSTCGVAIWIPLQDADVANGTMRYVPRSHLAGRLPHRVHTNVNGDRVLSVEVDEASIIDQPCRFGGAIAHDLHMIHGAGPNRGSEIRRALILDYSTVRVRRRVRTAIEGAVRSRRPAFV